MALVAYGSDSDSDTEERTVIAQKTPPTSSTAPKGPSGLSSLLPPPKSSSGSPGNSANLTSKNTQITPSEPANPPPRARKSKLLSMPTLEPQSDDSDDESSPFAKRQKVDSGGGLFDMLPAPKNSNAGKATSSSKASEGTKPPATPAGSITKKLTSLAPRTLKPAATSTKQQAPAAVDKKSKTTTVTEEDEDDEEPVSFFPLGAAVTAVKPAPQPVAALSYFDKRDTESSRPQDTKDVETSQDESQVEEVEAQYSNEMYAYANNEQYAYPNNDQYAYDQYAYAGYEGYYDPQAYLDNTASEGSSNNTIHLDDKSLQRLGGKAKGMSGPIQVIDVNASKQMQDAPHLQRTMGKSLPKNVDTSSINHLKPSTMQKRKHNIMSLAYQAKANEHTLAAQWSASRQTKAQTQAKYGF